MVPARLSSLLRRPGNVLTGQITLPGASYPDDMAGTLIGSLEHLLAEGARSPPVAAAIGLVASWGAGRAMQTILFEVPAFHQPTLILTAIVISAVSLLACVFPARRAARISPMEALAD